MSKVAALLSRIQKNLKAPKNQYNKFGKYSYRSCEDILEGVKPLLEDGSVELSDTIEYIGSRYYIKASATLRLGDEVISAIAYAREADTQKGMSDAQVTGSTSSYARKYSLNGLFAIDDTKDVDSEKPVVKQSASPTRPTLSESDKTFLHKKKLIDEISALLKPGWDSLSAINQEHITNNIINGKVANLARLDTHLIRARLEEVKKYLEEIENATNN